VQSTHIYNCLIIIIIIMIMIIIIIQLVEFVEHILTCDNLAGLS